MKLIVVGCAALIACHPKQPKPLELPELVAGSGSGAGSGSATPGPKPETSTVKYSVVRSGGRISGSYVRTTLPGGELRLVYHVVENGRGPHVEAQVKLAGDSTIATFSATGHHEMGSKVSETFNRSGNHVEWKSVEEAGDREVQGPVFFYSIADLPHDDLLVPAALKTRGRIRILPSGEAEVTPIGELTVEAKGVSKKLTGYEIRGLDFDQTYAWFDGATWFGSMSWWGGVILEGWEAAMPTVIARQNDLKKQTAEKLAATTRHVPPAAGLALTHATVLDIDQGTWVPDQTIVIVGDTIKAIGAKVAIPAGAEVVDLTGKRVMPGLIDMHSHTGDTDAILDIACGVTTVRDVGNRLDQLDEFKRSFDAGTMVGPSIVRYGFIEGRGDKAASSDLTAETVDEAKAAVAELARRGYEGIKIYNSMKTELVPVLAAEAHKRGMLVTGHVPVHMLANEAVKAGYDGIEHINQMLLALVATHDTDTRDTTRFSLIGDKLADLDLEGKAFADLLKLFKDKKTVLDPTIGIFEDLYVAVPGKVTPSVAVEVDRLPIQIQRTTFLLGGLPMEGDKRALYARSWDKLLAALNKMWKAKLHLVAGTDTIGGVMLHHELATFVRAGIPPIDALRAATIAAARGLRLEKKIGSIAVGKRADLAILTGDPLADITQLRSIERTVRAGVVYPSAPLFAAANVKP